MIIKTAYLEPRSGFPKLGSKVLCRLIACEAGRTQSRGIVLVFIICKYLKLSNMEDMASVAEILGRVVWENYIS